MDVLTTVFIAQLVERLDNCQAQPQPQLQLSWAEIALISSNTPTPIHPKLVKSCRTRSFSCWYTQQAQ